jgi:Rrf2 family transcriptional regulator, cysteine metabolism repressor
MRFSKRCEYGLKAAVCLSKRFGSGYLQSREIAEVESLPGKFLESVLLGLRSAHLLESKVGAGGGYRLARSPEEITVQDVVAALNGGVDPAGNGGASSKTTGESTIGAVSVSIVYERIDQALVGAIGSLSLADLAARAEDAMSETGVPMYYI